MTCGIELSELVDDLDDLVHDYWRSDAGDDRAAWARAVEARARRLREHVEAPQARP